ncbi:MAG TPA: transglycosylase domain-containing protein, partial [Actinomycetota bacterium]|nr:transglycosylase domain-containing protein [Actinomycetota bacterium]
MYETRLSASKIARLIGFVAGFALFLGLIASPIVVAARAIKPLDLPEQPTVAMNTTLYDVHGTPIATLHGDENRIQIPASQIPDTMRQAVVAAEDRRYYEHGAISLGSIVRALTTDVGAGDPLQGGSTIAQQYARNAYDQVGTSRTVGRKLKEALVAVRLENQLTKLQILNDYLNTIYFGRGAYGIEAAAEAYFNEPAHKLTLVQSAYLAGIIRGPESYDADPAAALARRNEVLTTMQQLGYISVKRLNAAEAAPVGLQKQHEPPEQAAYFVEYVRRLLRTPVDQGGFGLSDAEVLGGGLKVYTTLDLRMEKAAEAAVLKVLDRPDDPQVGMVAMTTDGQIRAMVGGRNFTDPVAANGFNYAVQEAPGAGRQVGSTFKPFTLAAFFREGYSINSTFDGPSRITIHDPKCNGPDGPWQPANYNNEGYGRMTVMRATEDSVNTVFAQLITKVGPQAALQAARDAGITSPLQPVCSITLGTFGVTPLEMARAYSTFAARGMRPDPIAITKIVGRDGTVLATRAPQQTRTFTTHVADEVNGVLQNVINVGTGTPAKISRPAAGKTGTTEQHRDVWFVGYTPDPGLTAAVWIGYPPDKNGNIKAMTDLHGIQA